MPDPVIYLPKIDQPRPAPSTHVQIYADKQGRIVIDDGNSLNFLRLESTSDGGISWGMVGGKPATFTPSAHSHVVADTSGLQAALDGKAASAHSHAQSEVTGLTDALAGKAASSHTHSQADVANLVSDLAGKAASSHTHAQSDITNLVSDLSGKAASSHTHAVADITDATGTQPVWIPAGALTPTTTNGAASGTVEIGSGKPMISSLDFDAATEEHATFDVQMPPGSWNEGTLTFVPVWSHAATTTNFGVVWRVQAQSFGDGDSLDSAFSGGVTSSDAGGTTNTLYRGPESSALTVSGTPASGDVVSLRVSRVVGDGGDTMAIDARLHGILLYYTNDKLREN